VKTLADRVSAFINAEGHLTQTDTSNKNATGIGFSSRGLKYTAWSMHDDDTFLQLSCAMGLEAVVFDAPLLRALWDCQAGFKSVKFSLERDSTLFICSVEAFFAGPEGYQPTFWRSVSVIETALHAGLNEIGKYSSTKSAAEKFMEELSQGDAR
jgi:hypothetical protein